jgi:hypothetical protein
MKPLFKKNRRVRAVRTAGLALVRDMAHWKPGPAELPLERPVVGQEGNRQPLRDAASLIPNWKGQKTDIMTNRRPWTTSTQILFIFHNLCD